MDLRLVLLATGLPVLIASLLSWLARPATRERGGFGAALAIAAGAAAGQFAVTGWSFAPAESWQWVPWITLATLAPAAIAARPRAAWAALLALTSALLYARLLGRRLEIVHGSAAIAPWCAGLGVATALATLALRRVARRVTSPTLELSLAGTSLATAGMALFAASVMLALLAAALGAACVAAAIAAAPRARRGRPAELAALVVAPALVAIALATHHYADATYSPWLWALVGAGALAPGLVGESTWAGAPLRRFALRVLCAAVPIGAALALAYRSYSPPGNPYE